MKVTLLALLAVFSVSCGSETAVLVAVTLNDLEVPADINRLSLRLSDKGTTRDERTYPLEDGRTDATITLVPSEQTPTILQLSVFGLQGDTLIGQATPTVIRFIDGKVGEVNVELCRGKCAL